MPKFTKRANRDGRTDGWTDPNYRKATLKKIANSNFMFIMHFPYIINYLFRYTVNTP